MFSTAMFTIIHGSMNELQDQWPPSDDASTSREETPAHQTLQDRAFSRTLRRGKVVHVQQKETT